MYRDDMAWLDGRMWIWNMDMARTVGYAMVEDGRQLRDIPHGSFYFHPLYFVFRYFFTYETFL